MHLTVRGILEYNWKEILRRENTLPGRREDYSPRGESGKMYGKQNKLPFL